MIHEISPKYRFPAERMTRDGRKTIFRSNLRLLDRLKVGFSIDLSAALKDPDHPISNFFATFNMGEEMQNRSLAFTETARWLTELSQRFDSTGGSKGIRLMSEYLGKSDQDRSQVKPIYGRIFILYLLVF
jgi:hypothetical protein